MIAAVIICYFALLIGISIYTSRKGGGNADFFKGGGKSPWYVVAIAMVGTSISGVTFISVPGMVQASQFAYLQMALGFIAGYVAIAYVLLPLYYRMNLNSLYGYLEGRFGKFSYGSGAAFFLLSKLLGCGVRMYLTAIVLQLVFFGPLGVPFWLNVLITMVIVWLYTFRGGVRTLVWTDMVQTLCLVGAVLLCIWAIAGEMGLDFGGLCKTIEGSGMCRMWYFDDVRDTRYFWKQFLSGMFTTIAMTGLDQDMMQKNLSCRNLRESRKNVLSYGVAFLPVNFLFLCLGVLLYIFAADKGISFAKPDDLFPTVACGSDASGVHYMPAAVQLLFVLGLVSAAFSSAGSALTALTTSFTVDVIKADRKQDEATLKKTRQRVHVCAAIVMGFVILGFKAIGNESVINAVYTVASYTYGPLLGLYCYGIFTKRPVRDRFVPFICILSPLICLVLSTHSAEWFGGYRIGFELLLINAAISAFGLWLSGLGLKGDGASCARSRFRKPR
ncbi:MAG: sodium:solute symporter [Candidatus Cryptobacteroides sp.]|nr:sodium:solute symporter [Rikenellaceae bacterium]MDY5747182.1 sodium:solute symporter [Candidatus Cryptobacteroides sp.]